MIKTKINDINQELQNKLVNQERAKAFRVIGWILRILFGVVFLYSGFVKAIDPLGHTYKMLDYLQAMNLPQPYNLTLIMAIAMIALEFVVGLGLMVGIKVKFLSWIGLLLMLFMTPLTLWLALTNAVSDCGCFGEALKISNWATFWKNVVLLIMIIAILILEKYRKPYLKMLPSWIVTIAFFAIPIAISAHCLYHLPIIDFMPYAIGKNIPQQMEIPEDAPMDEFETSFTYKNRQTGEEKLFESLADAPWNDTINWEYVSQNTKLIKKGYEPPIHDLAIISPEFGDITEEILSDTNYVFLFVMYNLDLTNDRHIVELNKIYAQMSEKGCQVAGLTASSPAEIERFTQTNGVLFPFYIVDAIPLKTMVRANPGIVILKNGTIIDKWNANDNSKRFADFRAKTEIKFDNKILNN